MSNQRKEQPVGIIELCAIELAMSEVDKFFNLCRAEIIAGKGIGYLTIAGLDT